MFASRQGIIDRIGQAKYDQVFDHDGDSVVGSSTDLAVVDGAILDADSEVQTILIGKGWSYDQMADLAANDPTLCRQACLLAAHWGAMMKPELFDAAGNGYFTDAANQARKILREYTTTERRSTAEPIAGKTRQLQVRQQAVEPKFYVAPSRDNPRGSGGF